MRSEQEMMELILNAARTDERIRAVIMNGSRANPNAEKDCFQDYDIVYVVNDIASFTSDHRFIDRFGELMMMQMPERMSLIPPDDDGKFIYLMQFADGNRIDLTLVPLDRADELVSRDSLSILLLDKDGIIEPFPPASDSDYWIEPPSAKQFADCCNEFWWVSTYAAKALWREELPYAKAMLEGPIRNMLIQMLEWHIGVETAFTVSAGKHAKYFEKYLEERLWKQYVGTYSDANYDRMWRSLYAMGDLFRTVAVPIAERFGYSYPIGDDERVTEHLRHVRALPKDAKEIYGTEGYKEVIPTAEPQAWPDCDEDIKRFVEKLIERLKHALDDRLAGIYLHGSLAMGSYYRPKSDIDLIVVVKDQLEAELAGTVAAAIANESVHRPTVGNVELSVITAETAGHIPVPTPFEVHYSSSWHDRILQNEVDYGSERTDSDILCHVTYVVQRGICLYGQPIPAVFGQVEWHDFMKAVLDDLEWILEDEHILETPYYSVLNICRVFQLISENSQQVHSKDEGGEWGLKHFPNEYRQLIRQALDIYRSSEEVTEELRKTGGKEWDREKLLSFRNYARSLLQDS